MERLVDYKYSELISAAFSRLPPGMANRLKYTHFFTGTDPMYAGLIHPNRKHLERAGYNFEDALRGYRLGASVSYARNQKVCKKQTTVILPQLRPIDFPIHELGHVLDEILGWHHVAIPVTDYAETNRIEAFAEAFTLWILPEYDRAYDSSVVDEETLSLFQGLESIWSPAGVHSSVK